MKYSYICVVVEHLGSGMARGECLDLYVCGVVECPGLCVVWWNGLVCMCCSVLACMWCGELAMLTELQETTAPSIPHSLGFLQPASRMEDAGEFEEEEDANGELHRSSIGPDPVIQLLTSEEVREDLARPKFHQHVLSSFVLRETPRIFAQCSI